MWIEFFVVGGIWFWLLTALLMIALIWETSCERPILALFTLGFYGALIHLFGDASVFTSVKAHPEILYIGLPAYFFIGAVWGIVKWALHVRRQAVKYKERRLEFLIRAGIEEATLNTPVPDNLKERWQGMGGNLAKPLVRQNKKMILTWMGFWPASVIWSIIDEPWRYIYDALHSLLQKISDKIYAGTGYEQDMKKISADEGTSKQRKTSQGNPDGLYAGGR
jgi:hypothetical protein